MRRTTIPFAAALVLLPERDASARAALALRPSGSEATAGLGLARRGAGQTREALSHLDQAASSGYAEANIGLGDAYRKLGQSSSAIEAYRTYLERLPSGSRASYARDWLAKLDKPGATPAAREPEPTPPSDGYRPAGELDPAATPPATEPPAPSSESAP